MPWAKHQPQSVEAQIGDVVPAVPVVPDDRVARCK